MHITSDRAPSITYKLINPNDPISQIEWKKQMAVSTVRAKKIKDGEGDSNSSLKQDTIEVHAYFDDASKAEGFFGLISYLNYVRNQIRNSYKHNISANKIYSVNYEFPWKNIDDSNVKTRGFENKLFKFEIDNNKILNLLVGHTIYNDPNVVCRELIQNSIDAVRLQKEISAKNGEEYDGLIEIEWNEKERLLKIVDNGTGMTGEIIENNLLKVGASYYQEDDFKKEFSHFSAISNFGIGILTCFLVSEDIEIKTCHPEEIQIHNLIIKKLHGKYLMRYLEKISSDRIFPHGTEISLRIRKDVKINILKEINRWIVFPPCKVILKIDDAVPIRIGYESPKKALEHSLIDLGLLAGHKKIDIIEYTENNLTLAFAVEYNDYFKRWNFYNLDSERNEHSRINLGTCIHGIRVLFDTPGFDSKYIAAICNIQGSEIPKTDVVRMNFEEDTNYIKMLDSIYKIYSRYVSEQIEYLHKTEGFSLTWATRSSKYLINTLVPRKNVYLDDDESLKNSLLRNKLLEENINSIAVILIEDNECNGRKLITANDIINKEEIWTVYSELIKSVDAFLSEIPISSSLKDVLNTFGVTNNLLLELSPLLCDYTPYFAPHVNALNVKEVSEINILKDSRTIGLKWGEMNNSWIKIPISDGISVVGELFIQKEDIKVKGLDDEIAIGVWNKIFILRNSHINKFMLGLLEKIGHNNFENDYLIGLISGVVFRIINGGKETVNKEVLDTLVKRVMEDSIPGYPIENIWQKLEEIKLFDVMPEMNFKCYRIIDSPWAPRSHFLY